MGASVQPNAANGRRRGRRRSRARPMSEINVTPFVDVMLVLLIIFMVAAPLLTVGVPVELPKTAAGALPGDEEEPLTVTMTAAGEIQIQTTPVAADELVAKLRTVPIFTGAKGTAEELAALNDQAHKLADLLCLWNESAQPVRSNMQTT